VLLLLPAAVEPPPLVVVLLLLLLQQVFALEALSKSGAAQPVMRARSAARPWLPTTAPTISSLHTHPLALPC